MTPAEGVKFLMLQITPDTTHLETRVGIKNFASTSQEGLSNAKGKVFDEHKEIRSECEQEEMHKSKVEHLMNNEILGNSNAKFHRESPLEKNPHGSGRRTGIVSFENTKIVNSRIRHKMYTYIRTTLDPNTL